MKNYFFYESFTQFFKFLGFPWFPFARPRRGHALGQTLNPRNFLGTLLRVEIGKYGSGYVAIGFCCIPNRFLMQKTVVIYIRSHPPASFDGSN